MGIRVHTVLGYGWEKFDFESISPGDERFEKDFLPEMKERAAEDPDGQAFLARIENRGWYEKDKKITSLDFNDFVKYDQFSFETDKLNPLILTTPFNEDWYRYDDIIDYYSSNEQENRVKLLNLECGVPKPIYPYDGFVNKNTGQRLVGSNYSDMWGGEAYFKEKTGLGFSDLAAIVPYEISLFCKVAKFPLDIYTARPMIYTYWC